MEFEQKLRRTGTRIEQALNRHLTPGQHFGPPKTLSEAMRHGALGGGKRLRPFLMIEAAGLFGLAPERVEDAACALECVHCYSLIHDDLPAMDDDELRRGRPTVHKAYGEAAAILAGDALLTLAFEIMATPATHTDPAVRARLVQELARAAGWVGMAGGQMLDMEEEAREKKTRLAIIQRIHGMKTAALFEFACVAGAILGTAGDAAEEHLRQFGQTLGHAFQGADDLLDATSSPEKMGKATAKDMSAGKASLVARMGVDKARAYISDLEKAAIDHLTPFGERAETLRQTAKFVTQRKS